MTEAFDQFFEGGGTSFSWGRVGSQEETYWRGKPRGGKIVSIGQATPQTDMDNGETKTWKDGSPRMQVPITIDTTAGPYPERDAADPNDTGHRVLWAKAGIQIAITQALREANAKLRVGGDLFIAHVGDGKATGNKNGMRMFAAKYVVGAPPPAQSVDDMFGGQQAVPASQPTPFGQQPAPQQAASPFGQQVSPQPQAGGNPFAGQPQQGNPVGTFGQPQPQWQNAGYQGNAAQQAAPAGWQAQQQAGFEAVQQGYGQPGQQAVPPQQFAAPAGQPTADPFAQQQANQAPAGQPAYNPFT